MTSKKEVLPLFEVMPGNEASYQLAPGAGTELIGKFALL